MSRPFSTLPTELVDLIAAKACRPELLALGRTDRRVHTVCLRQIYREISLSDARAMVLFFRTVISNKLAASHVLIFTMETWSFCVFKAFGALVTTGMSKLTSLCQLESIIPNIFHLFCDIHFPHLRDCTIPLTRDTAGFLRLHPRLSHLMVHNHFDHAIPPSLSNPPILLPALTVFAGAHTVAPLLLPGSQTELATITFHRHDTDTFGDTLSSIGATVPTLRTLFSVITTWDPALPAAIAAHLPWLSMVAVRKRAQFTSADTLPSFFLSIDEMTTAPWSLSTSGAGGASLPPSYVFYSQVERDLATYDIWLPTESDGATDWFIQEVIASTTLPPAYLAALQSLLGRELVATLQANHRLQTSGQP
ncbi:hypothetical protein C8R46DRAFT_1229715 [Mycena filopes]|nr:hypothetical protein C8R46DRAFT_1229715 [Mycena filopes]